MYAQGPLDDHKMWQGTNVRVYEVGMQQLAIEMFNWTSTYHSRGQELLLRRKCTICVDLFLLRRPSGRKISPLRCSFIKARYVCACVYVCVYERMYIMHMYVNASTVVEIFVT